MMFNGNSFEIKRKKVVLKNKQEIILHIILQINQTIFESRNCHVFLVVLQSEVRHTDSTEQKALPAVCDSLKTVLLFFLIVLVFIVLLLP